MNIKELSRFRPSRMSNRMALSHVKGRDNDNKAYLKLPMVRQVHPAPLCYADDREHNWNRHRDLQAEGGNASRGLGYQASSSPGIKSHSISPSNNQEDREKFQK
ncbi:hypothetical protein ALUC_50135S [Aspergillus luchuensis]|nr:hypothetical protein ALUC_50135S [Aspergillus luchuensis]